MGIFKLTKGELKKIFLKPGIFVVTALLVLVLTLSALLFNPTKRNDSIINVNGQTILQMYDASFGSTQSSNTNSKSYLYSRYVESSENIINFYKDEQQDLLNNKQIELFNQIELTLDEFLKYKTKVENTNEQTDIQEKENLRLKVKTEIENFRSLYLNAINGNNGFYYLLINSKDKTELDVYLSTATTRPFNDSFTHTATVNEIENELDLFNTLTNFVNKMVVYSPSSKALTEAENFLTDGIAKLNAIESEIEEFKTNFKTNKTSEKKQEFRVLITRYQQAALNIKELTELTLNADAIKNLSDNEIQNKYQFQDSNFKTKYSINERKLICKYYLETNKYAFEYANPLSLTISSSFETNVYDFMYFALELCSFIIIIYVIYLGATMITGEYASGTMKLLAIRPYSRRKILFSKLLATCLIGLIFLIITFIVTFISGGILFSLNSLPMLLMFNAQTITSTSPIVVMIILFICKSIEIIFYAIFALSISTLFKSNSGSVIISILIYFVSIILTMFTTSLGIIKFIPFVNTNLFGYFGSHMITSSNNVVANMFSKVLANDMNIYISFVIILLFSALLYLLTNYVFKKRDIK